MEDSDCTGENQYCTNFLWDGTKDGKSYGYGSNCYTWGKKICPAKESFAEENWKYKETNDFSYYTQYWCKDTNVLEKPDWNPA